MNDAGQSALSRVLLLGSVFVIAACGLVYELVAGAVSSYLLGDAVTQFSLVIGVFLFAMGVGSYFSQFFKKNLLLIFIETEILIGIIGGLSSILMFGLSAFARGVFPVFFYLLCASIGFLIGIEIPLLVRILKTSQDLSKAVSHVLAIDYIGALFGSILFPFLVLPWVGLSRASAVFGIMNLGVAALGVNLLKTNRLWVWIHIAAGFFILFSSLMFSTKLVGFLEDLLYQDSIIYTRTTPYQRIIITRWRNDIRLYLNGHIQFCSIDEARYHESLVIPPMETAAVKQNVLILGGGDGMAAREVLKYPDVETITLVDIDPAMTMIAKTRPELRALNKDAFYSPKVEVVNQDAMHFLETTEKFFNVILVDLPDPSTAAMTKLYSRAFYALAAKRLSRFGVLATQATSPFYAPEAFWCIKKTIGDAVKEDIPEIHLFPVPYHVNVPSFGEWGFVMAQKGREPDCCRIDISVPTRFLTKEVLTGMFHFGKDIQQNNTLHTNRLDQPVLHLYYQKGWNRFYE